MTYAMTILTLWLAIMGFWAQPAPARGASLEQVSFYVA